MNFDFNEARKNNSDEEILNSIKKKSKEFGYDFSATEIIDALDLIQKQRKQNQQIEQNDDDYESNYSDPEIIKLFEDIKTNPEKQDFNQTSTLGQNSNDFINRENFSKSINSLIENIGGIKTGDQEIKINTQEQNLTDENSIQNPLKSQNTQTKSDFREDPKYKGVFYNDKEDTRLSDGFSWQGALNTLTQARDDYTYENKTDKAIYDRLRQNVRIKLQNKAPIEDYTNAEKEILLKDYHIDIKGLNTLNSVLPTALTSQSDALVNASKIVGEKEQEIVNKNLNDLSQEDKEYLKDKAGLLNSTWNKIFHDDDKTIEEEYDKLRGGKEIQEASAAVERLKNFSLDKNLLFAIVSGDKTKEKAKKRFEDDLTKTAEFLGFDNVAIDRINENIFFEKDNKLYKLNDGFFDNFETIMGANVFSIGGGIAGAIKGAKSGKDPKSKIMKGAGYGALGGLGGGGMDYLLQSYRDNKEARFDELVTHAMQEGLLSLVGDGVVLALKPLTSSIKPAMKLVQKAPIINYFTQDLPEQNVNAAKKVVNNWFEPKNREEAKKIIDEMGGGIELENGNFYGNKFVDWVKKKLGENSKTAKIAKHLSNFFMMPNARERQKEVFNLLRASDNGAAILAEVAKSDARAGEKLKEIFNYSTQNLKMQLGNLNLSKDEITDILKSYESGTSSDYARMEKVLSAAYKNEKVKLDDHVYEKVKNKLMDENLVGEEIDSFLKDLKSSLFDRELSFKQLNNARKNLNSLFSQRQNYGEYLKRVLANELRQTIQGGIEEIFSKNPKMFEKANKLYNDTLEEYGILKELQKMNFFKSAKDPEVNVKEIADKVLNAAKSQGDVLAKFTSKLDKKNQARIELNILDEIFNQSLYKNGKLEVFDSKNFFKRLENAKFHSKEANDYIQIAKNFDRVFGNDANIAGSIGGYKGVKLGTGLATSVEGAAKYQQTRILLNSIIRNLPNPLGLFNDLTGNAALRFHVLKALRKSQTSQEFTNLMEKEIKKMPFTSSSRINLSEFLKDFKELKNKVLEAEVIEDDPIYTKELNNPIIPHNRQVELKGVIDNFRRQSQNGKLPTSNNDSSENLIKSDLENSNANPQMNQDLINQSLKDIDFIDNKGEVRTLSKETQKEWLDTFSLKSLHESYIPNHNDEIKQALKGKEIKLTKGSLLKLVVRNRQKYIAYIKETLDNPDFILKDKNELIFAKNFNQETYFTSIGKNYDTHFTIVSNAPKKQNTIKNKLDNGAKILYQSSKFENLRYNQTFTDERLIANKTDGKNSNQNLINQSLNKFNIFDLYRSKNDFLDIKKLEKSLEKYKESKPQEIKYKTLKRGYILDDLLNVDEDVSYAVVNKDDLKPSLTRSLSQFRNKHSNSTISNIRNSFNEREHFKESSNFDGIPTITKDGLIIAGNHRTTAIKDLKGENLARYIKQAKRVYGEEVFKGFDENKAMIVRVLDKNDDDTIIRLSKLSNDGRLSDESEKLQALGAKYKEKLSNIENAKLNSEKELMNFLGSKDVLESRRALLDHLMPDIYNALLAWEKRSGGDSQFSKILSDNALNFLHLKQALNENKVFKDNGNDFFSLFKRAIESMNQSNAYKNSDELYEMLKKYAEPSLNFEKEFIPNDKDLQADILAFIVKYNDTLTNPSEALGLKIQKAIDFIRDNDSFSLFDEIKLSNYDVLNQMLNANIATGTKYQELLNKATSNISKTKFDNGEKAKTARTGDFTKEVNSLSLNSKDNFNTNSSRSLDKSDIISEQGVKNGSKIQESNDSTLHKIPQEGTRIQGIHSAVLQRDEQAIQEAFQEDLQGIQGRTSLGKISDEHGKGDGLHQSENGRAWNEPGGDQRSQLDIHEQGLLQRGRGNRVDEATNLQDVSVKDNYKSKNNFSGASSPKEEALFKNYRLDKNEIENHTPYTRYNDNINALKLLKELENNDLIPNDDQKEILSKYHGWGGLAQYAFNNEARVNELKQILSESEFDSARKSVLSSFYTPNNIINAMVDTISKIGFKEAKTLEPAAGIGKFLGFLPKDYKTYAVEIDSISSRIAKQLYPNAKIDHNPFEKSIFNNFDLVIGNPPFGSMKILDTSDKNLNGMNIHNYFIAKGLDKLRENGLLAYIVSSSFLDAKNTAAKKIIANKGEFLGAVRLPNNVFKDTQVTSDLIFFRKYTKDDIKKDDWIGVSPINIEGKEFLISDYFAKNPKNVLGEFRSGEGLYGSDNFGVYLEDENILNKALENLNDYISFKNANFAKVKNMDDINDSFIKTEATKAEVGSFIVKDDRVYRVDEDGLSEVKMHDLLDLDEDVIIDAKIKPLLQSQIKAMKKLAPQVEELRSSLKSLQQAELRADVTDTELARLRFDLNKKYDSLIKQSGKINGSKFKSLYRYDGVFHKLAALEKEIKEEKNGKEIKKYEKSDIFFKRVLYPYAKPEIASTLEDAINISLNESNTLDYDRILRLLNKNDKNELQKELLENEIIFKNENGDFIEKNEFLSGDVKTKYEKLKNEGDLNDEYVKKSLDALEKVIPKDIDAVDIAFDIGSAWLPKHFLHDFVSKKLSSHVENIVFSDLTGWNIKISKSVLADNDFGVVGKFKSIDAQDVLNAALNDSSINMNKKIYDNGKLVQELKDPEANDAVAKAVSAIKAEFVDFIQDNPKLAGELQKTYNDIFNRKVLRNYNGDHLKLIGSNANIKLRLHQKNAVYRILTNNNTLIDHTVGTGKTWTMAATAMEMRRLGISKKPLFSVPKSIVAQFAKEFSMLYPNANILAMSKFDANNRKRILSSIATNDYDAVIISHDNLKGIDITPENEAKFLEEELRETKNALETMKKENGERVNIKNLEKSIATLQGKIQHLSDIKKDNIYFEDLGIDALFIDEAHKHKNLRFFTKLSNIKGLGNPMGSQIANDLYNKTRLLQRNNSKIVFATGTPIVNSIAEIFTLQRYLDSGTLKQQGISYFDQWVKKNGTIESAYELNAVNQYVLKTRLSSIKNIPELQTEFRSFADVVDNDQVKDFLMKEGLDPNFLPKIEMKLIAAEISPEQKEFMQSLILRSENLEKSSKSARPKVLSKSGVLIDDSAILIMNDARKASLDMRLIDPSVKDFKGSKINLAVEDIYQNYVKFSQDKGTQIVFCDLSTPKAKNKIDPNKLQALKIKAENGDEKALKEYEEMLSIMENQNFSVYDDMRDKLIAKGIKSDEIAFIHDYDSDAKRIKLFEAVNRGDVRVLFGSTQKMGAGVNVQERLVALHNLDITWTPADMEQRIGRIERQGNILAKKNPNFKALVRNYSTKEMLDARLWEILEQKMKFIKQLQKGELTGRVAEDISGESTIPADEFKAISTGNPLVIEEQKIRREIAGLVAEQKSFLRKQNARALQIENLEKSIANAPDKIQTYESILKQIKPKGKVVVKGISYDEKSKSKALDKMGELIKSSSSLEHFASYRGFDFTAFKINGRVSLNLLFGDRNFELPDSMKINEFVSGGLLTRMDNYLDKFLPNRIKILKEEKLANQKELATLKSVKIKTFDKEKELRQLRERLDEVMKLNMASKEEIKE
ncbi:hypothetical protein FU952_08035 [Campylobacter jejuni]|nr:hypothetical protein [Campylobacter jejuni]